VYSTEDKWVVYRFLKSDKNFPFPEPRKLDFFFTGRYFYLANADHKFLIGLRSNGNAFSVDILYREFVAVSLSDLINFETLDLTFQKRTLD
jgi:hypothetical protein